MSLVRVLLVTLSGLLMCVRENGQWSFCMFSFFDFCKCFWYAIVAFVAAWDRVMWPLALLREEDVAWVLCVDAASDGLGFLEVQCVAFHFCFVSL